MTVTQINRKVGALGKDIGNIRARQIQAQLKLSEYQEAYKAWPWQPRRDSMRPVAKATVPTSRPKLKTTNQATFVVHKTNQRPAVSSRSKKVYHPPTTKMLAESTYDTDFTRKTASRPPACRPAKAAVSPPGPFDSKTVYEDTYTPWTPEELAECRVRATVARDNLKTANPARRFQASTTAKEDYKDHGNPSPAKSTKPAEKSAAPTAPFAADRTAHRADSAGAAPSSPPPPSPPAPAAGADPGSRPAEESRHRSPPFDDLTIFRRDFPAHRGVKKEQSYKPKNVYSPSGSKFDDRTTQRMAYQAWPIPKREHLPWADRPDYKPDRAKLQLVTSYQCDYEDPSFIIPHALQKCRASLCKYENNLGAGESGPFDERTEYRSTFIAWDGVKRPASYKIIEKYQYPKTPFTAESTFSSHFKGVRAPPAKSCRPQRRPFSSSAASASASAAAGPLGGKGRPKSCPVPGGDGPVAAGSVRGADEDEDGEGKGKGRGEDTTAEEKAPASEPTETAEN